MAETLTVALRVAEEAIEEAIAKADEFSDSLVRKPAVPFLPFSLSLSFFSICSLLLFYSLQLSLSWPLNSLLSSWSRNQQNAVMGFN